MPISQFLPLQRSDVGSTVGNLFIGILLFVACYGSVAQELPPDSFPRILTISRALEMLDDKNPVLLASRANIAAASAKKVSVDSRKALEATMGFDLRAVDRISLPQEISILGQDFTNDSRIILTLDKPLSTFGKDASLTASIDLELASLTQSEIVDRAALRIAAIKAFFSVILADYAYAYIDEEMTLAYGDFDDARDNMERFEELAEVEVRALEYLYLNQLSRRTAAEHEQRASRLRLALALNRPDAHPDQMVEPDLSAYDRELPDYDILLVQVLKNSPAIQSAQLQLDAEREKLSYMSLQNRPVLGARFQAAEYRQFTVNNRDRFRASLYLDIPLNARRQEAGKVSLQYARILQQEAKIASLNHEVRTNVLALVQQLSLLNREMVAAKSELLYRELNLDRVRLQYEMEIRSRIGRANADVARALHRLAGVQYQRALIWEQIDALTGAAPVVF